MPEPRLVETRLVALSEIDDSTRLRPVSQAGVDALVASYETLGVMKDPIDLRRTKAGQLVLIAGGHRMGMARTLGWDKIEAKIWTDVTDDWSMIMEIDDNLAGAEMNALDNAIFLATRKRVYEKMHPETRQGVSGGLARQGSASELGSFAAVTAEKFGMTMRQIQKIVAVGTKLGRDEIDLLRGAPRAVSLKDL
ncbi:ParB N-terminal domain-containing protein, partial [Thalassovita sp.]|uniref:ParB N-terminal domain-containing protein n=1 Tax=Thalassovita sp. TaxID=1979401 RepID=UPI0028811A86